MPNYIKLGNLRIEIPEPANNGGGGGGVGAGNTIMLLNFNGTNGSNNFTDLSSNQISFTPYGDAIISTAQSKFGGSSVLFDGNSRIEANSSTLEMLDSDFTIEFWVFQLVSNGGYWLRIGNTNLNGGIVMGDDGGGGFYVSLSPSSWTVAPYTNVWAGLQLNAWQHIAATREGNVFRAFLNGVKTFEANASGSLWQNQNGGVLRIGSPNDDNSLGMNGFIDDFRIIKGTALYTSNFTPPIAQLAVI